MKRAEEEDTSTWLSIESKTGREGNTQEWTEHCYECCRHNVRIVEGQETVARPWYYFNDISALSSDYKGWGAILEASIWHEREATGDKESEELKMVLESKSSRFSHFQNNDRLAIEKTVKQDLKFLMNESEH